MRLPPNSRELFAMRRAGNVPVPGPFGHVAVLPSWNMEIAGAHVLAPESINALDLDFCIVAGLDVAIFVQGVDVEHHVDLILAVMAGDPRTIAVIDLDLAVDGLDAGLLALYIRRAGDE
ncbi:MAG: hypothetical protein AB1482_11645 [Pseudomonadota bacterium]